MKKIFLLLAVQFVFLFAISASITQVEANRIVGERMSQETQPYTVYAKNGVQTGITISTSIGEALELDYRCWVYYIFYTDTNQNNYLIFNENNGNLLEVNAKSDATPNDLAEWKIVKIKIGDKEKESFSEWLIVKIDEIETIHKNDIAIINVRIFKGEWKGQVAYFINNTLNSCMFCDVYYEEGEKVIFEDDVYSFYIASKDWKLIYEFGKGIC